MKWNLLFKAVIILSASIFIFHNSFDYIVDQFSIVKAKIIGENDVPENNSNGEIKKKVSIY